MDGLNKVFNLPAMQAHLLADPAVPNVLLKHFEGVSEDGWPVWYIVPDTDRVPANYFDLCYGHVEFLGCDTLVDRDAFTPDCDVKSINFGGIPTIPDECCHHMTRLEKVQGEGVIEIGERAFESCTSLKKVKFENLTTMKSHAFEGTAVEFLEFKALESVPGNAFGNCVNLKRVTLESSNSFGARCFIGCIRLLEIIAPNTLIVRAGAFKNCEALRTITLKEVKGIEDDGFRDSGLMEMEFPKLTHVGKYVFYNCKFLTSVSLQNVRMTSEYLFGGCKRLQVVSMLALTFVHSSAFSMCVKLSKLSCGNATIENGYLEDVPALKFTGRPLTKDEEKARAKRKHDHPPDEYDPKTGAGSAEYHPIPTHDGWPARLD